MHYAKNTISIRNTKSRYRASQDVSAACTDVNTIHCQHHCRSADTVSRSTVRLASIPRRYESTTCPPSRRQRHIPISRTAHLFAAKPRGFQLAAAAAAAGGVKRPRERRPPDGGGGGGACPVPDPPETWLGPGPGGGRPGGSGGDQCPSGRPGDLVAACDGVRPAWPARPAPPVTGPTPSGLSVQRTERTDQTRRADMSNGPQN